MFIRFIALGSVTIILGEITHLSLATTIDDGLSSDREGLSEGEIKPQKLKNIGAEMFLKCKVGYVFLMVVFSMLSHAENGRNSELAVSTDSYRYQSIVLIF